LYAFLAFIIIKSAGNLYSSHANILQVYIRYASIKLAITIEISGSHNGVLLEQSDNQPIASKTITGSNAIKSKEEGSRSAVCDDYSQTGRQGLVPTAYLGTIQASVAPAD
jgi:hypothetical protein